MGEPTRARMERLDQRIEHARWRRRIQEIMVLAIFFGFAMFFFGYYYGSSGRHDELSKVLNKALKSMHERHE